MPAYVSIRQSQHTSAYVSLHQHTSESAYASIRQHTPAYVSIRQTCGRQCDRRCGQGCHKLLQIFPLFDSLLAAGPRKQLPEVRFERQHTSAYVCIRPHTSAYVSIARHPLNTWRSALKGSLQTDTSAYVCIRQHTSAYVNTRIPEVRFEGLVADSGREVALRQTHTPRVVVETFHLFTHKVQHLRQHTSAYVSTSSTTKSSTYVSIRQHTSAYVSIRQHTSAYASIRQHTSAYVSTCLRGLTQRALPFISSSDTEMPL
jgi:hypothetical protein